MKKTQKVLVISVLVVFLMACNCNLLNMIKEKVGLGDGATAVEGGSPFSAPTQETEKPSNQSGSSDEEYTFVKFIPTEVIIPDGVLQVTKFITTYDEANNLCETTLLIENTSTDPLDVVKEFSYIITWYDDQGQMVDQWDHDSGPNVFPQEATLFEPWVHEDKLTGHKVVRAVFEITEISTVKSKFPDGSVKEHIANTPLNHPFFPYTANEMIVENDYLLGTYASTTITVQSSMENKLGAQVIAVYYDDQDQVIGIGKSPQFEINPGESITGEVEGYALTELPVRAEYYPIVVGQTDLIEVVYPGLYN